jgi:peptidoglycan/xylan/chitin deacetylase (PgdA/CDA1 family)
VRRHAAVAQRVVAAGHEIAHHMMQDEPSIRLSPARFQAQFDSTRVLLEQLGGAPYFRPGSGWYNQRMRETVEASGYRVVLGSVYPFDAQLASPAFSSWYIRHNVSPGAIIILHEANGRGPRTAEVLRAVLPELKRQGLRVVTVSELLRQN